MPKTALLVIDVQTGMTDNDPHVYEAPQMLERVKSLIKQAEAADIPVVYVEHIEAPEWDGPLHPDIAPQKGEPLIQKMKPDAFHETNLKQVLDDLGVDKLVIAGFETPYCINATSRRAHELGYDVTVVEDTHSTFDQEAEPAIATIARHNEAFREFATLVPAEKVRFGG
jgi:nicotinamidase-related amidase